MNKKRLVLGAILVFVFVVLVDYLTHGLLLAKTYKQTPLLWRRESDIDMLAMLVFQLLFALCFVTGYVFCFCKNFSKKTGLKYGVFTGLILGINNMATYVYMPISFYLASIWLLQPIIMCTFLGLMLGKLLAD